MTPSTFTEEGVTNPHNSSSINNATAASAALYVCTVMSVTVEQAYDRDAHLHSSRHAIQLDAETLYLDLVVNSSKVLKSAIRKPSS